MATFERTLNALQNMDINMATAKHTLHIDFPAEDLLPKGVRMVLHPPANVNTRDAPPFNKRNLGVGNTNVLLNIPVQNRPIPHNGVLDCMVSLAQAADAMHNRPGTSNLAAVMYYDDELKVDIIRLCLLTKFALSDRVRIYEFDLTLEEWQSAAGWSRSKGQEWAVRLDDLISRGTDHAYYHVRNNIKTGLGEEAVWEEEGRWVHQWGSMRLRQLEEKDVAEVEKLMRSAKIDESMRDVEM